MQDAARIAKRQNVSVATAARAAIPARNSDRSRLQATLYQRHIQAKLRIGRAGDECEQEADRVAAQVVTPTVQNDSVVPIPTISTISPVIRRSNDAAASDKVEEKEEQQQEKEQWLQNAREAGADDPGELPNDLVGRILSLQQGGVPLPSAVRDYMEPRFGVDFSTVRIHDDNQAAGTAQDIHAYAFTLGEHISFAPGAYRPETVEGKKLLAHELTHVVQQRGGREGGAAPQQVRRIYIPGISELVDAAGNFLADQGWRIVRSLNPALEPILRRGPFNWLKDRLAAAFDGIVGRINRLNPQGMLTQLTTVFGGLVERASVIVSALVSGDCGPLFNALNQLKNFVTEVAGQAWNKLTEFLSPVGDFFSNIWGSYGAPAIEWLQNFAGDVWGTITQFGRDIWSWTQPVRDRVGAAWNWVKEKIFGPEEQGSEGSSEGGLVGWVTRKAGEAWDWLKQRTRPVWEPIASAVQTVRELIPPQFVRELGESMRGLSQNLNQTGEQMNGGANVAENREALAAALPTVQQVIGLIRGRIVSARGWIITTVSSLSRGFSGLLGRLRANSLLSMLANALSWMESAATQLTAWVQEKVATLFDWIVQAFDFLTPFVEKIIATVRRVISVVGDLMQLPQLILGSIWNLIPACIRDPIKDFLVNQILRRIPVFSTLLELPDMWARVQATAMRILRQLFVDGNLAGAAWTFFSSMLRLIGLPPELVVQVLAKAASAIGDILTNPIGFLINTLRAVKEGFSRFFGNIFRHLMGGIAGWLFGHMRDAGITPPQDFSLRSILGLVMQILGISVERVLQRLGRRIGQENVARLRRMLDAATGVWSWVAILIREGPAGLWREVRERLSGLWQQVLSGVVAWVNRVVIQRVSTWLLSMLDPSGIMAVVNSLVAIYRAIESFVQYLRQMLEIVNTVLDGINGIARGAIGQAAGFLENALSNALPIAIGFLANQLGLGGLGRRLREMVGAIRERVDGAIDWLIDRALRGGRAFLDMLRRGAGAVRSGVNRLREWWRARRSFRTPNGESHQLYFQGSGRSAQLMMASQPRNYRNYIRGLEVAPDKSADKERALAIAAQIDAAIRASSSAGTDGSDSAESQVPTLLQQLATITSTLGPAGPGASTPPQYGGLHHGYGTSVEVTRLTAQAPSRGGAPSVRTPDWNKLNQRRQGGRSFYIRGHLLNHNLGGPGNTWLNLTPITQSANNSNANSMLHKFETPVKTFVEQNIKAVHFIVTANYGGRPNRSTEIQSLLAAGDTRSRKIAEVMEQEQHIPTSIQCRAVQVNDDGNDGAAVPGISNPVTVDNQRLGGQNTVDESPENYEV